LSIKLFDTTADAQRAKMMLMSSWSFLKKLFNNWSEDRISSQAAALAYYTLFSLAPFLLICIFIIGMFFGEEAARGQIVDQIGNIIGKDAALQIQEIIQNANRPNTAFLTRTISGIVLLFSATGIFSEIQEGLNTIWGVKTNPDAGWIAILKKRFLSFVMVLGVAFLLLASLLLSALLSFLSSYLNYFMSTTAFIDLIINDLILFVIITLLFAMMYKILPDVDLSWPDVALGAFITSVLFSFGKILIGVYLIQFHIPSIFGVASSLIVILIWVFYSAQIFFIGAEITKIISMDKGKKILPSRHAILIKKN
jgi:membrane protein